MMLKECSGIDKKEKNMRLMNFFVMTILFSLSASIFPQEKWVVDKPHSSISFEVDHVIALSEISNAGEDFTLGSTRGQFKDYDIKFIPGKNDFSDSQVEVTIQVKSVETGSKARDVYLRSSSFFDVEKYPLMTFKSTSFKKTGENTYKVIGDLTIKNVTKPMELEFTYSGKPFDSPDNDYISFTGKGLLYRNEYGLVWGDVLEKGGFRISYYVRLNIQANFMRE